MQPASLDIWQQKYQLKDQSGNPIDADVDASFRRVARKLASVEKDPERWYPEFLTAMRNGAIPAGRILSNAGAEEFKPSTSTINCFAGETPVLTRKGIFNIQELAEAGKEVEVLNGNGNWSNVLFKHHGKQQVHELRFKHADTKKTHLSVRATAGHRWILASGQIVNTEFWVTGAKQKKGYNQIQHIRPKTDRVDKNAFDAGVLHGTVYGDGSIVKDTKDAYYVTLFGEKLEIADAIPELLSGGLSFESYDKEHKRYTVKSQKALKELPNMDEDISYLKGFFAGVLATDGNIHSENGRSTYVKLYGQKELRDWCVQNLPVLGITVTYTHKMAAKGEYTNLGERKSDIYVVGIHPSSITEREILRSFHRRNWKPASYGGDRHAFWQFQGVAKGSEQSFVDVYCCEEPETHSFCLGNGLLTGNCVVSKTLTDSISGIMQAAKEGAESLAAGCGIGYCFSTLRPKGAYVNGAGATTSGALSFMNIFDATCFTIASAGGRRG